MIPGAAGSGGAPWPGMPVPGSPAGGFAGAMPGGSFAGGPLGSGRAFHPGQAGGSCCAADTASAGDCAGTCGGMEAACCEAEGAVTDTRWAYVGEGRGAYSTAPTYNYVGDGCGGYEREVTTTYYGWKFRKCCLILVALLLLPPVVY